MRLLATAVLAAGLAGCGGDDRPAEPKEPQAALRLMLDQYNQALADGDWAPGHALAGARSPRGLSAVHRR
jgi:hypothetical protein